MPESIPRQLKEPGLKSVQAAAALGIFSFVLAALYFGREVLEPLAMAVLLAFVLTPPIRRLRAVGVGRVTSVIAVVVMALSLIGALGFLMGTEVTNLAQEIPHYQNNLHAKIASLNKTFVTSGTLSSASKTLNSLASELKGHNTGAAPGNLAANSPPAPIPVEVHPPQPAAIQYLEDLIGPLLTPLTTGGLLILFLVFILFYREDLRDRILRLAGKRDLQRTTEAMNEAGERLSRFFLIQAAINGSFGLVIGTALWAIGIPNAALWGTLAAILRFVPYVGTPIAAVFPLVLAAAIDPGWTMVLATGATFLVAEIITGQAIEPVLQGHHTGLSPLAIVVAQLFWTLIWGVPGLILAVPVTVCLAVVSRHIEGLSFLEVILGDEPALAPHEAFYQRLLANDATEATFQAEKQLETEALTDYYDAVPMKALAMAHADAAAGKLSEEKQAGLLHTIEEVIEDLEDYTVEAADTQEVARQTAANEDEPPQAKIAGGGPALPDTAIHLLAARGQIDHSASLLLADILGKLGFKPSVQLHSSHRRSKILSLAHRGPHLICISSFGGTEIQFASMRYLIRRWKRLMPEARVLACFWHLEKEGVQLEGLCNSIGADFVAASLKEAARICSSELTELNRGSDYIAEGPLPNLRAVNA